MVKGVDDTLYISAPTSVNIGFVGFLFGVLGGVVFRVSVHKTVTHDEVDDVGRGERLAVF